jgi:CRP-like cAMP-binding protein
MPLSHHRLLSRLPPAVQAEFMRLAKPHTAKTETILIEQDSVVDEVYFPTTGMVSLVTLMNDGTGVESATVGDDGIVGVFGALFASTQMQRAIVQMDVIGHHMTASAFTKFHAESEPFRTMVSRANELLMSQYHQSAACNALHPVEMRLARWLLLSLDRLDGEGPILLTQEFLSDMLAVRRSSVSEVAAKLQKDGLITYARGRIEIVDKDGLKQRACECFGKYIQNRKRIVGDL